MKNQGKSTEQLQIELERLWQERTWEKAAESIRSEVLFMRSSGDLMKVSLKMYQELLNLGIETPACAFFFVNEEEQRIILYVAFPNPRKHGISWTSPDMQEVDEQTATAKMDVPITSDWEEDLEHWRQGEVWNVTRSMEEDVAVLQPFHDYFGLDGRLPAVGPDWIVNNVPFKYGWVSVRYREDPDEYTPMVVALTEALALGYRRYLDFKHLEENVRLLEQDKVVERIRTEAMAMRSSKDLLKVLGMMWEEMVNLGIDVTGNTIRFVEEDENGVHIRKRYYAFQNPRKFGISWTSPHLFEFNEEVVVGEVELPSSRDQILLDSWRRGEALSIAVSGEDYAARTKAVYESWGQTNLFRYPKEPNGPLTLCRSSMASSPL